MQPLPESALTSQETGEVSVSARLVEVRRGPIIESRHRGHVVAVDANNRIVAYLGTPEAITYLRSSAKPFQAIPLITSGAADRFGFTEKEIALACASHSGEAIHTELALSMLKKIGLQPDALKCGTHEPFSAAEARLLREQGRAPSVLQNNCSGKHAGMLALALHLGAPTETYEAQDNPIQIVIQETVARFADCPPAELAVGVDGCAVPVFGLTVRAMALMYARLVKPESFDEPTRRACERISTAMLNNPEIIGGTTDRLDTEMMRAAPSRLISKVGAEGVYTVGVLPCDDWPAGLGVALKIEDGDDARARPTAVIETLRQLGVLDGESLAAVARFARFPVTNRRGDTVGEVRPAFELQRDGV